MLLTSTLFILPVSLAAGLGTGTLTKQASYPMLVIGNTADPVTPLRFAKKPSQGLKDSVVLTIDAGGHCSLNTPSICALQYVRQYFQNGTLPEPDTVCEPTSKNPFLPPPADEGEVARGAIEGVGSEVVTQLSKLQSSFSPFSQRNRL